MDEVFKKKTKKLWSELLSSAETECVAHHGSHVISPNSQYNADRLFTGAQTPVGSPIVLHTVWVLFCMTCYLKGLFFIYFLTSTPSSEPSPQPGNERSSVYMLKLHLFYSQLYKTCETNCS